MIVSASNVPEMDKMPAKQAPPKAPSAPKSSFEPYGPKPKKKKTWLVVLICFVVAAGLGVGAILLLPSLSTNQADVDLPRYEAACRQVDSLVNLGANNKIDPLIAAIDAYARVSSYENTYPDDKRYKKGSEILTVLKRKAASAAKAWEEAAKAQRAAGNYDYARKVDEKVAKLNRAKDL